MQNNEIADALLATLRDAAGNSEIAYAEPPVEIEGGFDTRIFSFRLQDPEERYRGRLILRLFDADDDPLRAGTEGTVQNVVAGLGYPAPEVLTMRGGDSPLGAPFIVMKRLPGAPMLQAATFGKMLPEAVRLITTYPAVLADYMARLHELDAELLEQKLEAEGLLGRGTSAGISQRTASVDGQLGQLAERIERLSLKGFSPALQWLRDHRPAASTRAVICHGDFHPINVMMDGGVVTGVLDWANTTIEDPAFDIGNSRLLLGIAPLDQPAAVDVLVGLLRKLLVRRFTRAYVAHHPVDMTSVQYFEALRCLTELAWVADRRAARAGAHRNPWDTPRSVNKLASHFHQVAGIKPALND